MVVANAAEFWVVKHARWSTSPRLGLRAPLRMSNGRLKIETGPESIF